MVVARSLCEICGWYYHPAARHWRQSVALSSAWEASRRYWFSLSAFSGGFMPINRQLVRSKPGCLQRIVTVVLDNFKPLINNSGIMLQLKWAESRKACDEIINNEKLNLNKISRFSPIPQLKQCRHSLPPRSQRRAWMRWGILWLQAQKSGALG